MIRNLREPVRHNIGQGIPGIPSCKWVSPVVQETSL